MYMSFVYQAIQIPFKTVYDLLTTVVSGSHTKNKTSVDIENHIVNVKNITEARSEELTQKPYFLRPKKQVSYVT